MKPPSPVEQYIKSFEGLRLDAYDDATGKLILPGHPVIGRLTIGFGHTGPDVYPGQTIVRDAAQVLFHNDMATAIKGAVAAVGIDPWMSLTPPRRGALIDMCFEMGERGLDEFQKMLAAVRAGDWDTAAAELMASKYSTEVPARAASNKQLLLSGSWPRGIA